MPQIDVEAAKLFERSISKNDDHPWIDIVNPAPESAARFAEISGKKSLRWHSGLDRFQDSDAAFE